MTYCTVKGCHNASEKQRKPSKITFHKFPNDPILADRWIKKIRLNRKEEYWKPTKHTIICSVHFDDSEKYITKGGFCKLRVGAVPTKGLHIFCRDECQDSNHDSLDPLELVKPQLGASSNEANENINFEPPTTSSSQEYHIINCNESKIPTNDSNEPLSQESDTDLDYIFDSPREAALRRKLDKKIALQHKHNKKIKILDQKVRRLQKKNLHLKKIFKNLQKKRFTENDVSNILSENDKLEKLDKNVKSGGLSQRYNCSDSKSECDSSTESEMTTYPYEDALQLGQEKSEEIFSHWENYWATIQKHNEGGLSSVNSAKLDWSVHESSGGDDVEVKRNGDSEQRMAFALRHGERVDLTYGAWVPHCFDGSGAYTRKDLNMPLKLGDRAGGADSYYKDTPLTRVGQLQAQLVGEGLRLAGVRVRHVYASAALRCVETAHAFLIGHQADPSIKVKVESGLFEFKAWHFEKGIAPFMTPLELHKAGYNVDLNHKEYIELDIHSEETVQEYYERTEKVMHSAMNDTEKEGGNVLFVGHASTLDLMVASLKRLDSGPRAAPYTFDRELLGRVSYCALGAMRARPWRVVAPPCPPSINSASSRFDWRMLAEVAKKYD